jgi:hypothetical protein
MCVVGPAVCFRVRNNNRPCVTNVTRRRMRVGPRTKEINTDIYSDRGEGKGVLSSHPTFDLSGEAKKARRRKGRIRARPTSGQSNCAHRLRPKIFAFHVCISWTALAKPPVSWQLLYLQG